MKEATELAQPTWPVLGIDAVEDTMAPFADLTNGMCGLAGRYDGIDLPGDACKLVVLAGLPDQDNLQERFFAGPRPRIPDPGGACADADHPGCRTLHPRARRHRPRAHQGSRTLPLPRTTRDARGARLRAAGRDPLRPRELAGRRIRRPMSSRTSPISSTRPPTTSGVPSRNRRLRTTAAICRGSPHPDRRPCRFRLSTRCTLGRSQQVVHARCR